MVIANNRFAKYIVQNDDQGGGSTAPAPAKKPNRFAKYTSQPTAPQPAPMSQPDASPWGDGQAFDDMYARKPQTDPMLSPLRPDARTLTAGQPTRMKPPPAPRGPVMSPAQRQAMAPERAAGVMQRQASAERREAAGALGGGMDMLPTIDAGGNVKPGTEVDRDLSAGIIRNATGMEAVNAASRGAEGFINLPGDAVQSMMGGQRIIPKADLPEISVPKELASISGDISGNIWQFLLARGVIGKAMPGGGFAAQAGKDALALGVGFDSDTPRMAETLAADFMRENGMGWMTDRDPNNPLMERVKNGIEEMFLAYAPVEVARRTPQVVDAITGVGRPPNTPTNAGGAKLAPAAPPVAPVAPAVAAPQAPTQPQTVTAPPVPPIPPSAPAVTAGAPQPGPAGQVPPAGQLTPVSNLGPAEQAFNNLPMKTRESMLNAFQSAGIEPNRAKAMIGELNNLPDGQNTMYALEVMRRNGLSDADIDGVLIAMGREFATESPRPAGRVFNREQDSARQIMNDQVRTQINSEGRSITDVAERNFGEGVVPAGEALDLELDQLSNAYETILSTKRSPTGRLRSPAKKDAVYRAREELTNALVSPEVMQTIPQDVKLQIMMQASDDMRRLKFTPDELSVILQGDGKVLAPLFNGYGALSWSPDLWAHLARQYPTQAAHSLQSALRKAADEAFRRGDATAGRYYKRLRGESGKGGLLDTLERAVPKYKETRVQFGDASSAKEALDILERFKAAAASEGDVAKIIKDLEGLPQRHREMAEQQITSIIRQELARKVESPRLAELGQTVAQTPNLTSLSRQDFLKALEDVFGPRGKELADAIRAARARTDTLTSISPKYNSRTELNRQDVQNAPALYEAPGSLEGGIIDAGVKRLGTVAGGASLIPGGQGAALALGAATAVQAAMNAARRGKRLSNAERNALVEFLFKSRTANDAAPPVATRGPSMGDYAQAIGRDAVIGAGVGAVADGDPLNNDPMALIGGAVGGATGYGRARLRNARSLIKPPPAPRGAGRRNTPPAGPGVGGPNAPRPLPGQTSNSAPAVTGALVGGAAGYAAAPEDQKGLGLVAGVAGGGVLANRLAKGSTPKAPPSAKAKPGAWKRDPATVGLGTQDYLAYINAKHPPATPNQTPPYFIAASTLKRAGGDRQAAAAELADYAAYLRQSKAAPEVIENVDRAAKAVADVDPMFFDDKAFNDRMKREITAGGEAAVAPARGAADALPGERPIRRVPPGVKPPPVKNGMPGGSRDLPMDEGSRMERARSMGFDVDTPLYHGTALRKMFDEFNGPTYLSTDKNYAKDFAWETGPDDPFKAQIVEAYGRGRFKEIDENSIERLGYEPDKIAALKREGFDGARSPDGQVLIFDPKNIRHTDAAFDPSQEQSSKLLAGMSGNSRGLADNLKQDAALAAFGSAGGSFANQDDPQAGALGGMGIALGAKYGGRAVNALRSGAPRPKGPGGPDQAAVVPFGGDVDQALMRRIEGGDETVVDAINGLSAEKAIRIAKLVSGQTVRSGKQAKEAITDAVWQAKVSQYNSQQLDKFFPPPPEPPKPKGGWEPTKEADPRVVQFRPKPPPQTMGLGSRPKPPAPRNALKGPPKKPAPPKKAEEVALINALKKARATETATRRRNVMRDNRDELNRVAEEAVMQAERDLLEYRDRQFRQAAEGARWMDRGAAVANVGKKAAVATGNQIKKTMMKNDAELLKTYAFAVGGIGATALGMRALAGPDGDDDKKNEVLPPTDKRYFVETKLKKRPEMLGPVQNALVELGMLDIIDADTKWGTKTRDAIEAYLSRKPDRLPNLPIQDYEVPALMAEAYGGYQENGKWFYNTGEPIVYPPKRSDTYLPARPLRPDEARRMAYDKRTEAERKK